MTIISDDRLAMIGRVAGADYRRIFPFATNEFEFAENGGSIYDLRFSVRSHRAVAQVQRARSPPDEI
jgi:hypothetical protein